MADLTTISPPFNASNISRSSSSSTAAQLALSDESQPASLRSTPPSSVCSNKRKSPHPHIGFGSVPFTPPPPKKRRTYASSDSDLGPIPFRDDPPPRRACTPDEDRAQRPKPPKVWYYSPEWVIFEDEEDEDGNLRDAAIRQPSTRTRRPTSKKREEMIANGETVDPALTEDATADTPRGRRKEASTHPLARKYIANYERILTSILAQTEHCIPRQYQPPSEWYLILKAKAAFLREKIATEPEPPALNKWFDHQRWQCADVYDAFADPSCGLRDKRRSAKVIKSIWYNFTMARIAEQATSFFWIKPYNNERAAEDLNAELEKLRAAINTLPTDKPTTDNPERGKTSKRTKASDRPKPSDLLDKFNETDNLMRNINAFMADPSTCAAHHCTPRFHTNGGNKHLKFDNFFRLDRMARALNTKMLTKEEYTRIYVPYSTPNLWIAHLQVCHLLDEAEQLLNIIKTPKGRPLPKVKKQTLRLTPQDDKVADKDLPWLYWEKFAEKKNVFVNPDIIAIDLQTDWKKSYDEWVTWDWDNLNTNKCQYLDKFYAMEKGQWWGPGEYDLMQTSNYKKPIEVNGTTLDWGLEGLVRASRLQAYIDGLPER